MTCRPENGIVDAFRDPLFIVVVSRQVRQPGTRLLALGFRRVAGREHAPTVGRERSAGVDVRGGGFEGWAPPHGRQQDSCGDEGASDLNFTRFACVAGGAEASVQMTTVHRVLKRFGAKET